MIRLEAEELTFCLRQKHILTDVYLGYLRNIYSTVNCIENMIANKKWTGMPNFVDKNYDRAKISFLAGALV